MSKGSAYLRIFAFLSDKRAQSEPVSIEELAGSAKIKTSTARVYYRNRLKNKYLSRRSDGRFDVTREIDHVDADGFVEWMSQNLVSENPQHSDWLNLVENANQSIMAAIEIHNKPLFQYRYQVVTILLINAWELALKAYIAKNDPQIRLTRKDGTTKPFEECLAHVSGRLGNSFPEMRDNLEVVYRYRCEFIHFYVEGIDVILFGLVHKSVELYHRFITRYFGPSHTPKGDFVVLPIGFKRPVSPIDFLTNESTLSEAPGAVKALVEDMIHRTENLAKKGIDDLIFVPFSVATINETRVKNADIVAAISKDQEVSITVRHEMVVTDNPEAREVRVREDELYGNMYRHRYSDVTEFCKNQIPGWKQNSQFHGIMRQLKQDPSLHRVRLLDPENPKGPRKDFYSQKMLDELKSHYLGLSPKTR